MDMQVNTQPDTFTNRSIEDLVDDYGLLHGEKADIEARMKIIQAELSAREPSSKVFTGTLYKLSKVEFDRKDLDSKRIKEEMPASWVEDHTKTNHVIQYRIGAR
jgi:hypothetical protein